MFRLPLNAQRQVCLTAHRPLADALQHIHEVEVWDVDRTDWNEYQSDDLIDVGDYDTILVKTLYAEHFHYLGVELSALADRRKVIPGLHALARANRMVEAALTPRAHDEFAQHIQMIGSSSSTDWVF